jgi:hypothetical protein
LFDFGSLFGSMPNYSIWQPSINCKTFWLIHCFYCFLRLFHISFVLNQILLSLTNHFKKSL